MLTETQEVQLVDGAATWGLTLDKQTVEQFARLAVLLEEGNQRLNLTRVDPGEFITLHFLDSLALAAAVRPECGGRVIDVGTGAGFPGIPLALAFPTAHVTLIDATRKRLDFVESVIAELGISNVRTVHGRAEEIGRHLEHQAAYDLAIARAVAKLPLLARWLLPFVRPGKLAVAYKSKDIYLEVADSRDTVARLGARVERVVPVQLPFTGIVRSMVIMRAFNTDRRPIEATQSRKRDLRK